MNNRVETRFNLIRVGGFLLQKFDKGAVDITKLQPDDACQHLSVPSIDSFRSPNFQIRVVTE